MPDNDALRFAPLNPLRYMMIEAPERCMNAWLKIANVSKSTDHPGIVSFIVTTRQLMQYNSIAFKALTELALALANRD
jgi:hypothetical protein